MGDSERLKLPKLENVQHLSKSLMLEQPQAIDPMNYSSTAKKSMTRSLVSPFAVPSDHEVLQFFEDEKVRRQAGRDEIQNSRIWEKKTASQRRPLKHYKDFQVDSFANFTPKHQFNESQKRLINQALEIVKERTNQLPTTAKKESLVEIISQRKEMFHVSMSHDILAEEIKRIKQVSKDRFSALVESEKMLKQDHDNFSKYLDANKQQRVDAENKADNINKQKRANEATIKEINLKLTTIRAEKSRNEEMLAGYKEHKEFLDKLNPKEWEEDKQKKRMKLLQELKTKFIEQNAQDHVQSDRAIPNPARLKKNEGNNSEKNKSSAQKLEAQFMAMYRAGEVQGMEEFEDNYPMYFQHPNQLQEIFNSLEEKNLFLIQMKQEDEQNFEELKHQFKLEKQVLNSKSRALIEQKEMLKKQLDDVGLQIRQIKQSTEENNNTTEDQSQRKFKVLINDLYNNFKEEINLGDPDSQNPLFVLSQIEILFEKQFKEVLLQPIKIVEEKRKKAEKDRKQLQRDALNIQKKEEIDRRNEKNRLKMTQAVKKKTGRIDMERSAPFTKVTVKEVDQELNEIDEDIKYFREDYRLL